MRTSYGSRTGRNLAGLCVFLGLPFIVLELLATRQDPGHLMILLPGAVFFVVVLAAPALHAVRLARALRIGRIAQATVTNVTVQAPGGYGPTIEAMTNGFAAGQLRLVSGGDEIRFESDAIWAPRLQSGTQVEVLVDPRRNRMLWIIGPVDAGDPVQSSDRGGSRTMPGR